MKSSRQEVLGTSGSRFGGVRGLFVHEVAGSISPVICVGSFEKVQTFSAQPACSHQYWLRASSADHAHESSKIVGYFQLSGHSQQIDDVGFVFERPRIGLYEAMIDCDLADLIEFVFTDPDISEAAR